MAEQHPELSAAELAALYEAKALAELADGDALAGAVEPGWRGEPLGPLAFVTSALPDAGVLEALDKAADALDAAPAFVIATRPEVASRPDAASAAEVRNRRLALMVEAADPAVVIALDVIAAADLAEALGAQTMVPGQSARAHGRVLGFSADFAASLSDAPAKARVWAAMKAIAAEGGLKAKGRPKAPRERASGTAAG
jgi:hypothetical protein